jgi:hypothetical protein
MQFKEQESQVIVGRGKVPKGHLSIHWLLYKYLVPLHFLQLSILVEQSSHCPTVQTLHVLFPIAANPLSHLSTQIKFCMKKLALHTSQLNEF